MSRGSSLESSAQKRSEPIDKSWYEQFKQAGGVFDEYGYLSGSEEYRQAQRRRFEAGEIENPTLDYPQLNAEALNAREENLLALKKEVLAATELPNVQPDTLEALKKMYHWRLNEKIAGVRLLQAAERGESRRVARYSTFIYGRPMPETFSYIVRSLNEKLDGYAANGTPELQRAAAELRAVLPQALPKPEASAVPPDEALVRSAQTRTLEELGDLIALPEGDAEIDSSVTREAFEHALQAIGAEGWRVVHDPNIVHIGVSQANRVVNVPAAQHMRASQLRGLILHEIGTHVLRRLNGERSTVLLLATGLDRYEKGEEGVATFRQQAGEGGFDDFVGLARYLAIGLAKGLDGTPRDFRGVYDTMVKFYVIRHLARQENAEVARQKAADDAWNYCVRVFQGTDCKTPGAAFTKDIVYMEGNMGTWELVKKDADEMLRFSIGKCDLANPRHVWLLAQLGVTDQDLAKLAE